MCKTVIYQLNIMILYHIKLISNPSYFQMCGSRTRLKFNLEGVHLKLIEKRLNGEISRCHDCNYRCNS
jgi:hypothetical protein